MATAETNPDNGPTNGGGSATFTTFQWLVAWLFLFLMLAFLNRTRFGHVVIYYTLIVLILLLVVTNYKWFAGILAPFSSLSPALTPASAATAGGPTSAPSSANQSSPATIEV